MRWEQGGFILYYKRLEMGTFELPMFTGDTVSCQMSWPGLMLMIEGIYSHNIYLKGVHEGCAVPLRNPNNEGDILRTIWHLFLNKKSCIY